LAAGEYTVKLAATNGAGNCLRVCLTPAIFATKSAE